MDYAQLLLVALLSVLRVTTSSPIQATCQDDLHLVCPFNDLHNSIHEDGFSLLHEETLSKHCKEIIEDIECKKSYLSACNPDQVESFSLATDGVREVLKDLCNDTTDIRKAFRVHSPCIVSVEDGYGTCILSLSDHVEPEDYDASNDITQKDVQIRRMCRFYEPFKRCVIQATSERCGDAAAQLVEQLVVRMATPAVTAKCTRSP